MELPTNHNQIENHSDSLKTEEAIWFVKDTFSEILSKELNLAKVSAPIAVLDGTGINDDLNGIEKPVSFKIKGLNGQRASIVQSLAKWKRLRLHEFNIEPGKGILTDMRALRPDEELSQIHSIYVDQWDWEKCISKDQRTLGHLKETVEKIYEVIKATEVSVCKKYDFDPVLPDKITFVHAEELLKKFPDLTPKERENMFVKNYGAIFIIGIGGDLSNGEFHDGRAPDYDDWSTKNEDGYDGLNGDIVLWNPILNSAFEVSSMGIRVNKQSLEKQLEIRECTDRKELLFHKMILNDQLPLSIGGGIGQARMCMFFLKKSHIGEVQSSIWPENTIHQANENGLLFL